MFRRLLGDRHFYARMMALVLPVALQNLLSNSLALVDNIMVGQLGEISVAAVGLAGQWSYMINMFFFGASSGAAVLIAQYYGAGDGVGVRQSYGLSVLTMMAVALPMMAVSLLLPEGSMRIFSQDEAVIQAGVGYLKVMALSYPLQALAYGTMSAMRSIGQVRLPLVAGVVSMLVNVVMNYLLIFGKLGFPAMGASGAAIASVLACFVQLVIILISAYRARSPILGPLGQMLPRSWGFVGKYLRLAMPVILNEGLWGVCMSLLSLIFARIGTADYAAYNIMRNLEGVAMSFFWGMGPACSVLIGSPLGRGDRQTAWDNAVRFLILGPVLAIAAGLIVIILRWPILSCYHVSQDVLEKANLLLIVFGSLLVFRNFNYFSIVGVLRSGGDTTVAAAIDLGSVWLIALPMALLGALVLKLPGHIVFIMITVADVVKSALSLWRIRTRKWMNTLTTTNKEEVWG